MGCAVMFGHQWPKWLEVASSSRVLWAVLVAHDFSLPPCNVTRGQISNEKVAEAVAEDFAHSTNSPADICTVCA